VCACATHHAIATTTPRHRHHCAEFVSRSAVRRRVIKDSFENTDLWFACESQVRCGGQALVSVIPRATIPPALVFPPLQLAAHDRCSFLISGVQHIDQPWWTCGTCTAAGRLGDGGGVCGACMMKCHAGHALAFVSKSLFFCDCGPGCACRGADAAGSAREGKE
jgi:hypothetical protein